MPKQQDKKQLSNSLAKLQEIVAWFEAQSEVDVEEGLKKMREGAALVKELKSKLAHAENEFEEIKKDLLK